MDHLLDNPVWHALIGAHAGLAIGAGRARHYPRDIVPFSAVAEPTAAAYEDLARDLPDGAEARLFRPADEPLPAGWESFSSRPILQMIRDRAATDDRGTPVDGRIRVLKAADRAAMLELAEIAKPGPFARRTPELGAFVGVFDDGRLVAMAGERFRVPGFVEFSAIATRPEARRRGLAAALIADLSRRAAAQGEIAFLHVFPDNPAVALYERLGFKSRVQMRVLWRRPGPR